MQLLHFMQFYAVTSLFYYQLPQPGASKVTFKPCLLWHKIFGVKLNHNRVQYSRPEIFLAVLFL